MVRVLWGTATNAEESRAYLQSRLIVFSRVMFWAFVALLGFLFLMYKTFPNTEPAHQNMIWGTATVALASLAVMWRYVLLRRTLAVEWLDRIDAFYVVGSGVTFALAAYMAADLEAASYTCLVYNSFTVFTRALLVPSTGRRTAIASAVSFVPLAIAAVGIALDAVWIGSSRFEVPRVFFVAGDVLYSGVAVLLAATGSRIIYTLSRQVDAAKQLGQYTLIRKIGEGGMGEVHEAQHVTLRRPTAVKRMLPDRWRDEDLDRFENEVRLMSQLTHPNTVAVYDYGRSLDGELYYAMEYLGGGVDLEKLVRKDGPQSSGRVAQILAQVCGSLQEAHERGFIHRDIKPLNIILCERGGMPDFAKVLDFGLAKEIAADVGMSTQVVLGTPQYLAPESFLDPASVGPAVDLYALGAVGYYMLTGRSVFDGKTTYEQCVQHASVTPTPPSQLAANVAPELEAIVMRCLEKQPGNRFANAAELADALRAVPTHDWTGVQARAWWRVHKDRESAAHAASTTPTMTITVDLGQREDRVNLHAEPPRSATP